MEADQGLPGPSVLPVVRVNLQLAFMVINAANSRSLVFFSIGIPMRAPAQRSVLGPNFSGGSNFISRILQSSLRSLKSLIGPGCVSSFIRPVGRLLD